MAHTHPRRRPRRSPHLYGMPGYVQWYMTKSVRKLVMFVSQWFRGGSQMPRVSFFFQSSLHQPNVNHAAPGTETQHHGIMRAHTWYHPKDFLCAQFAVEAHSL